MAPAAVRSDHYTFKDSPHSSHQQLLASLPAEGTGRRVLDLGCGPGHLAAALAARGYVVTGVERPGATGSHFPETVQLVEADLEFGLPALDPPYDYLLCADVLEHLRDPGSLLLDLHRLLRPGGMLIASLPNSGNIYFRLNVLFGRFPQEEKGLFDRTHLRFFTWDGWVKLFAASGFPIESTRVTGMPIGLKFERWSESAPVRAAEAVCYQMARIWRSFFAYQFVVTARNSQSR